MAKVDVKKLKKMLTLSHYDTILRELGIPIFSKSNTEWRCFSGDRHKNPYDGSPSLIFYPDTKIFQGYSAGRAYDAISLVQTRLNLLGQTCSFLDACNWILEKTGLDPTKIAKPLTNTHVCDWSGLEKFVRFRSTGSTLEPYDKSILDQLNHSVPQQWLDEGISIDTMTKYQIGYYERNQATTIPCFNRAGELVGIRCRHWLPNEIEIGKYRPLSLLDGTTYKFPTNNVFFGINWNWSEIERVGHVILVEGEKSVLKADSWWGEKSNVLALYGSNLGLQRRNQLIKLGVNHVTIAIDSDFHKIGDEEYDKFEKKVLALARLFKGYATVDVIYNNIELSNAYKASPFDFNESTYNLMWDNREVVI